MDTIAVKAAANLLVLDIQLRIELFTLAVYRKVLMFRHPELMLLAFKPA